MRRKYFPNKWQMIKDAPAEFFPPMLYAEFEDWKVYGYEIPSRYFGIIRVKNPRSGVVKEYVYKSEHHAKKKIKQEILKDKEITLCTMQGVWHIEPNKNLPFDFNNP